MAKPSKDLSTSSEEEKTKDLRILEDARDWGKKVELEGVPFYDIVSVYRKIPLHVNPMYNIQIYDKDVERISFVFVKHLCAFAKKGNLLDPSPRNICAFFDKHITKAELPDDVKEQDAESRKDLCARELLLNWAHKLLDICDGYDNAKGVAKLVFKEFFQLQKNRIFCKQLEESAEASDSDENFTDDVQTSSQNDFIRNESEDAQESTSGSKMTRDESKSDPEANRMKSDNDLCGPEIETITLSTTEVRKPINVTVSIGEEPGTSGIKMTREENVLDDDLVDVPELTFRQYHEMWCWQCRTQKERNEAEGNEETIASQTMDQEEQRDEHTRG